MTVLSNLHVRDLRLPRNVFMALSSIFITWKVAFFLLLLANIKSLPFVWHIRMISGFLRQLYSKRPETSLDSSSLFLPLITTTRAPLAECDYNGHKSNSTYYSDLDASRLQLLTCLIRAGRDNYKRLRTGPNVPKGRFIFALGGVTCSFRKEIKPYQPYEIWSRVLSWDNKWLYIVSYFVEKGAFRPERYLLQPDKRPRAVRLASSIELRSTHAQPVPVNSKDHQTPPSIFPESHHPPTPTSMHSDDDAPELPAASASAHKAIFATAISRFVMKKGRLTIPPAKVLFESGLAPDDPNWSPPISRSSSTSTSTTTSGRESPNMALSMTLDRSEQAGGERDMDKVRAALYEMSAACDVRDTKGPWSMERVEAERLRGLDVARLMGGWDAGHLTFKGEGQDALGRFPDLFF